MNNNMDNIMERLEQLENELSRRLARDEIENLFSAYQSAFTAAAGDSIVTEFWSPREDITIEIGASGVYLGPRGVSTYYQKDRTPGNLTVYTLSSPCVQIAEDGRSARGLWTSVGLETCAGDLGPCPPVSFEERRMLSSKTVDGLHYRAEWIWQKFAVTFVLERGGWKIWRLHACELMRCPFDRDWVLFSTERFDTDGLRIDSQFTSNIPYPPGVPPENNAFGATTFHWQYAPDALAQLKPEAPKAYRSLEDESWGESKKV